MATKKWVNAWLVMTLGAAIKERLSGIGAEPGTMSPAEFSTMIKRDIARWKKVAQEAGIRL